VLRLRPLAVSVCVVVALCLLCLWGVHSQTGGLRRVTNTTEEGININPSLSGDGRRIAFESTEDLAHAGGTDHFRATRADLTSDPAAFTQISGTRAPAPGISQDGSRIAFAAKDDPLGTNSDGNSEIFLFDGSALRQITNTTPGDTSRRIVDGNFQPSLTDDGRFIAFSSNRNLANQNSDGNLEVFIFDTTSNTFTQLTNTAGTVGATDAKISGDGARVAYIRDNNASPGTQRDLVLQDRSGGATRLIAGNVTNLAFTYGRAISDDGLRIVYSADIATDSSQVFLFDGRTANSTRQITALGVRTTEVPLHPTISGDGTRIAFATRRPIAGISNSDNSIEVYTFDIPTGQFARVTNAPSNADGFDGSSRVAEVVSSLNDDGSIVAFNFPRSLSGAVTTGLENNSEIYVTGTAARPTTGSLTVLNEASFGHEPSTTKAIAPDSNAVALGGALAFTTQQAPKDNNNTFPTTFGGTTVTVNGRRAQITFISPTQVNFIVPGQTEVGTAEVVVTNEEGFQSRGTVTVLRAAPGIFSKSGDGQGEGVVLNANMQGSGTFDPSDGQLRLIIFTTGVRHATQVTATAGGRALTVESFMASPDMPGMDEVHVLVPADLRGAGTVNLVVRADSRDSNPVTIIFAGNSCRDIVINEVLADPPDGNGGDANHDGARDSNDDEFVELVNTTAINIDISGYQLLTRSTSATSDTLRHTFAPGTLFPAGSAIVVFGGGGPNFNPTNAAFGGAQVFKASSGALSLTNSGGVVTLREPSQSIVNIFSYGGSTGLNGDTNQSLTRSPDAGTNADCGSFTPHTSAPGSNGQPFSPGTRVNGSPFASGLGRLTSITISPPTASVTVGQTTQFTAQARDQFGRPLTNATITFASDNTNVATVDGVSTDASTGIATGNVTGRSEGTAHITAQATDGTTTITSSQATLTVSPLPAVVTRVEVSPQSATINRGQTQQFTATAFDQNNQPIAGATFTWNSSDTNVAAINSSGLATGVGLGSVTITATTPDATGALVSGTATLNVQVPLIINEINADVPVDNTSTPAIEGDSNRDGVRDSDDDEFVELLNNSNASVDISGVIIADATSNRFTVPANTTLAAGRALVIFGGGTPNVNDPAFGGALVLVVPGSGTLSLNDTGDTVNVKLNFGGTDHSIASVTYGGTGNPAAPSDQSLTRSPDAEMGTTGGSFVAHSTTTNAAGRTFSPGTRADGTPFGSPAITRIEVSPASAAIDVGATQVFTARAFSNTGGPEIEVQNISFIWDSSDTTKATVAPTTGASTVAKAVASGSNIIIRARAGAQQGNGTLTINSSPPVLTSITISPTSATINAGQTQQFTGQALDQFGQPIGGVTVTFASNNTTVATVDSVSPTSGTGSATATVTGQTNGSAEIRATATNGTTTVTSLPATLTVAPVANPGDVVISEFRFRGPSGANDEFIELYNRTTAPIDISGYKIFRSNNAGTTTLTATINASVSLGPGCHYLLTNSNASGPYSGSVAGDQTYSTGITDDGGIALTIPGGTATTGIIDQVGLSAGSAYKEGTTLAPLTTNVNQSYERKPGGAFGNGTDTNNNASDFLLNAASSNPQNLSSGCLDLTTDDLAITKTDSPDPVTTGTNVTYTITVTNNGAGSAQSVIVTDNLPGTVSFVSCSSTGGGVCGGTGNNRSITFSSLASGSSATITLVATANGAAGTTITNTATITSNTPDPNTGNNSATETTTVQGPLPTLSINDVSITEGDSGTKTVDFTVTLSASSTQTVTVGYATSSASPATATADTDYQSTSGTVTFNPGETSKPVTITIKGDILVEPDETFFVNLSSPTSAVILDGQGLGTILDDDKANLVISQVFGGGGNAGSFYKNDFIEIYNRGNTVVDISAWSVQYRSPTGTTGNWSVTNLCGSTTAGTCLIQPGQYYLVQEAAGTSATGGTADIAENVAGTTDLGAGGGKVALVNNTTNLGTTTCVAPGGNIIDFVGYGNANCSEGNAAAPATSATTADFRKSGGCIDTNNNAADFASAAPAPRNTSSPTNTCAAPSLSINDATISEGGTGTTTTATFTVSLNTTSTQPITVNYATADGTATAPADYLSTTGTLTFNPGELSKTISITVNGDTLNETNETFFVNLSGATNASITVFQGQGTITDDDAAPTISIDDVTVTEGNTGTVNATFTVTLSAASGQTVTVSYATADGTATAPTDYKAITTTALTFNPGETTKTVTVLVNGDTTVEPDENFFVNLSSPNNATFGDNQGQGTITNDDIAVDLSLVKTVDNSTPDVGGTVVFTIMLSNSSTNAATNVQVTDQLPAGLAFVSANPAAEYNSATGVWTVGTVNAGTNRTLTITATVQTAGAKTNTAAIAASDQFDPDTVNNQSSVTVTPRQANLSITKTDAPDPVTPGGTLTYTITVTNNGPDTAQNITVTDSLPSGLTFASCTATGGLCNNTGNNVTATYGSLANGASATITLSATVSNSASDGSTISNTATISSDTFDPNTGNNTATATTSVQTAPPPSADLSLTKSVDNSSPNVGDQVVFTIQLGNGGPDAATNVQVKDQLPSGLTFVSANPVAEYNAATGIWTVGTINNGATRTLTITAAVTSTAINGVTNTAQVFASDQADSNTANNQSSVTVTARSANLSLTKTVDNATPNVGQNVTFTLTLNNGGPNAATGVQVTDQLPSGLTFVSANPSGAYNSATGVWTVGTVNNGASATLTITATATTTGAKTNTATISASNQFDPNTANNQSSVTVTPQQQADLSLTKTVNNATPNIGERVIFTIALSNTGSIAATGVQVTDLLPSGLQYVSSTTTQGTYANATGIWTVGTVNVASPAATLTITATVSTTGAKTNTAEVTASGTPDSDSIPNDGTGDDFASVTVTSASNLVINEALVAQQASPPADAKDFVELYNKSSQQIDISGLVITYRLSGTPAAPSTFTLPSNTLIPAGGYLLIANGSSAYGKVADFDASGGTDLFNLNNSNGGIKIELNGVKLDGLAYRVGTGTVTSPYDTYGEGNPFTGVTSSGLQDLIRSSTSSDTNDNATDFHRNGTVASVSAKAVNP
jgi:uncharacterized repeat protein (TIGR01451 family)